jgi:hypothetical protein
MRMIDRLLFLEPGQLRRAWPFLALYAALFAALTLADGLSLTLFVSRLGSEQMPRYQALAAVFVMLAVGAYLRAWARLQRRATLPPAKMAARAAPEYDRIFVGILAGPMLLFAAIGIGLNCGAENRLCLGLLFLGREVLFALVLLQFGDYLQDYFSRSELLRVMPVIYAGGRIGGMLGGAVLEHASQSVGPANLLLLLAALLAACIAGVKIITRRRPIVEEPLEPAAAELNGAVASPTSTGILSLAWSSPLVFWITISTTALFFCRAGLGLQCGLCFQREFVDDMALAQFLGRYAQIAMAGSLVFQLLLVGRLVNWAGLRTAQLAYPVLIVAAALSGWGGMTLAAATGARFVEGELRYALRNPLSQMTINVLPRRVRMQARAWSMGLVIPAATFAAAVGLDLLMRQGSVRGVAAVTIAAGAAYLVASLGLAGSIPKMLQAAPQADHCQTYLPAKIRGEPSDYAGASR